MTLRLELWPTLAATIVILSWIGFVTVFLVGRNTTSAPASKREPRSVIGIAFQALAYAVVWSFPRQPFTSLGSSRKSIEIGEAIVVGVLAIGSVCLFNAALRTLGKQWSLAARVLEEHKLITEGPYRIVRNPIYTAMLGMLLATGLAFSRGISTVAAVAVFMLGTFIRIASEEKLLRATFGEQFEVYMRRVRAIVPFVL